MKAVGAIIVYRGQQHVYLASSVLKEYVSSQMQITMVMGLMTGSRCYFTAG